MTTTLVDPGTFLDEFKAAVAKRASEVARHWESDSTLTDLMLRQDGSVLSDVASSLGLVYYREYWSIDAVLYQSAHESYFAKGLAFAKSLSVAVEHENFAIYAHNEINKLTIINAPLRVLITYPTQKNNQRLLREFSDIIAAGDQFDDFGTVRKFLVIFGHWENGQVQWDAYLYQGRQLLAFPPSNGNGV